MTCSEFTITPFASEIATTVSYSGSNRPIVSVLYLQPDNTLIQAGIFTEIIMGVGNVTVNHGEVSSGYIKLLYCDPAPPLPQSFLITELYGDKMITEQGVYLIPEL